MNANKKDFRKSLVITDEESQKNKEETEKLIEENALKEFELGTVLKLPKGTEYRESVYGGREGKIGNSSSPEDGIYVINRYAEVSDKGVSSKYGLDGKINKNDKDSKLFVHISFVPGAKTEKEAREILEKSKDKKEYARGWMRLDELKKAVDKQKQQENQNQK